MKAVKLLLLSVLSLSFFGNVFAQEGNQEENKPGLKYSNASELSLIANGGNSQSETLNAKTSNIFDYNKNIFTLDGHYTFGSSSDVVSTRNYSAGLRYDRELSKKLSVFFAEKYSANKFSGYLYRWDKDLGVKYNFIKTDKRNLNADLGLRYTIEKNTANSLGLEEKTKDTKGRLFSEYVQKMENGQFSLWVEYLPNFSESENWQLNFGPSVEVSLAKTLSLKVGYTGKYDNQIEDTVARKYDYQLTTALLFRYE